MYRLNARVAVYEMMPLWDDIQELILKGGSSSTINEQAEKLGLITLQKQSFKKVTEGMTAIDKLMRVVA